MPHRTFWLVPFVGVLALIAVGCSRPEHRRDAFMAKGDEYAAQNKFEEASIEYRKALTQDPMYAPGYAKLGDAFAKTNDLKGALSSYVRASDLAPDDVAVNLKAGNLLLVARRYEDAKARARNILVKNSKNVAGLVLLGNALAGLQSLEEAVDVARRAVELDPTRAGLLGNLGVYEMARGRPDEAERAFLQAATAAPTSVSPLLALANLYQSLGRFDDAERVLKQALDVEPLNAPANAVMASILMQTGRAAMAEPFIKNSTDVVGTLTASLGLADYYVSVGRISDALALLQRVSGTDEGFAVARIRGAVIDYAAGRHDQAHRRLKEVIDKEPKNAAALAMEARLLLSENQFDAATALVTAALAADPQSAAAYMSLGKIHLARGAVEDARKAFVAAVNIEPRRSDAQIELSRLHAARGEVDSAVSYARTAVKLEPDGIEPRFALARALMLRPADFPRAEAELKTLSARYPNSAEVHSLEGLVALQRNDRQAARKSLERALQIDPDHVEALSGLTALDAEARRLTDARARLEARIAATKIPSAGLLLLAAKTYVATGQMDLAEQALRRIVELDPNNLSAFSLLGQFYIVRRNLPVARKTYEELIRRQPNSVSARTMLGLIAEAQGDLQTARTAYEAAVRISPRAAPAANNLAWLLANTANGNLATALQLAQSARALLPDSAEVADTLGYVYYLKGSAPEAVRLLETAAEQEPTNANFQYHLGLAYAKTGNEDSARQAMERALKLNPKLEGADEAKRVLATLVY